MRNEKHYLVNLKVNGDKSGSLVALESNAQIPFDIMRVFYIYNSTKGKCRGKHANRNSKFFMIILAGSCKIKVNDGKIVTEYLLDSPNKALFIDNLVWKEMYDFSGDAVLLIITNTKYDNTEYIHDYQRFILEANE